MDASQCTPTKCPFPWGHSLPHLIHMVPHRNAPPQKNAPFPGGSWSSLNTYDSLPQPETTSQTALRSVQSFSYGSRACDAAQKLESPHARSQQQSFPTVTTIFTRATLCYGPGLSQLGVLSKGMNGLICFFLFIWAAFFDQSYTLF